MFPPQNENNLGRKVDGNSITPLTMRFEFEVRRPKGTRKIEPETVCVLKSGWDQF